MKKIFLFDADGVLIIPPGYGVSHALFSAGLSEEVFFPLFKGPYQDCQRGTKDLKEVVVPYLNESGWKHSVDSFLRQWFTYEHHIDEALMELVEQIRKRGKFVYLFSDQEKYRGDFILHEMHFEDFFDGAFLSHTVGYLKNDIRRFEDAFEKLEAIHPGLKASDIFFIDDAVENVEVARSYGIDAVLYADQKQAITEIQKRL